MGGASKEAGLLFRHLRRDIFEPHMLSGSDMTAFALEWDVSSDRYGVCDISDTEMLSSALRGFDIVFSLVASADARREYSEVFIAAKKVGVKLRILRCIFGLGYATPDKADLFLVYSKDSFLAGHPCVGCHVVYPPLPRHVAEMPRNQYRAQLGIPMDAFVVAYASAEQRMEFYEVAMALRPRRDVVFLSALSRPESWTVPPNVLFCGTLSQRQMASLYDASDVVLHTRTESFGYSVHQGVAAGKPVIALWTSSINAFSETMYPGGGYLAKDVAGAVHAVEHVYRHRDEASARARTALARAERLAPETQVPRFEALMLRALAEKGAFPEGMPDGLLDQAHWPGDAEVARWATTRSEIELALGKGPFV